MSTPPPHAPSAGVLRSAARLAAIQALYQMDVTQIGLNDVIAEFSLHRFGHEVDGMRLEEADRPFFADLLRGVVANQRQIDPLIAKHLAKGWRLARIDPILRAILRAGVYELMVRRDVPEKVVINEYVEIAKAFFEGEEPGVVNAILDRLARTLRPDDARDNGDGDGAGEPDEQGWT